MRPKLLTFPVFALVLIGCAQTQPRTDTTGPSRSVDPAAVESLARDFEQVAFTDVRSGRTIALERLRTPIYVQSDAPGLPHSGWADSVVLSIGSGSGVGIRSGRSNVAQEVFGGGFANGFYVDVVSDRRLASIDAEWHAGGMLDTNVSAEAHLRRDDWPCLVTSFAEKGGRVVNFVAIRDSAASEQRNRCLSREILGFMGLHGAVTTPGSIFSDNRPAALPNARDLAMVRMLCDPRLEPEMTAAQARPLLPAVAADALAK